MVKLSVVTSLYNSTDFIDEFCLRTVEAVEKITDQYEIIVVNDGSPDDSADKTRSWAAKNGRIKLIELSRNYGHHYAMLAGMANASGDYVCIIDSDLEEDPAYILNLWEEMQAEPNLDMIYGIQKGRRKGRFFERFSGSLFYSLFAWLSDTPYVANQLTARIMKRRFVQHVLEFPESLINLSGIFCLAGFKQKALPLKKTGKDKTSYNLSKKIILATELICSFSTKPLQIIFWMGFIFTSISLIIVFYLVIQWSMGGYFPLGWPTIITSLWLIGGLIMMSLGVIGIYTSKIFLEVKRRPRYHISSIYSMPEVKQENKNT